MGAWTISNTGDSGVISNWFGLHWTISDSFGDISVILDLWGCSWGLWNSIKQIKAPFVFYWEHGIAEHAVQGNCASSLAEGEDSWIFSSCGKNLGYFLELWRVSISILLFLQQCQHSCLVMMDTSGIYARLLRTIRMLLEVRSDTEDHFLFDTVILGFLTIFKNCQASLKFKSVNSTWF